MSTTSLVAKTAIAAAVAAAAECPAGRSAGGVLTSGTALTVYSHATRALSRLSCIASPAAGACRLRCRAAGHELDFARTYTVRFADVAALIDPTTVVQSLTDGKGTTVLEQNYQFDLVSTDKLLQRYIDRPIAVEQVRGTTETFTGTLLSTWAAWCKRDDGTVQVVPTQV